jgi:DNA-binding beta-propeller fold protein YncE
MTGARSLLAVLAVAAALCAAAGCQSSSAGAAGAAMDGTAGRLPAFKVDAGWPKPLPENWIPGQVAGIAVAGDDTIWVIHRPGTLVDDEKGATLNPPATKCCRPAPPVLQFDAQGNLLRSWGGPGAGYEWPQSEHGIFVDSQGNVWLAGNDAVDHQILKFTLDGRFLQQIGQSKSTGGSNSATQLGRPAHMMVDTMTNELYVADGYLNRRVVVFDATTGAYKRHWGGYGTRPNDDKQPPYDPAAALSQQFGNPVHCVRMSNDRLLYVCDRVNDRIQVFKPDGTYVTEFRIEPRTLQNGSVWDLVLSEDREQKFIFIADGANNQIVTIERATGKVLTRWGRAGRMAGQFKWVHNMAIDSKGNLYTAEVGTGRRAQKFERVR